MAASNSALSGVSGSFALQSGSGPARHPSKATPTSETAMMQGAQAGPHTCPLCFYPPAVASVSISSRVNLRLGSYWMSPGKGLSRRGVPVGGPRKEVPRRLNRPPAFHEHLGRSEIGDGRPLGSSCGPLGSLRS
eukprot:8615156-Pyramimonas_sp.AAC.1